MQYGQMSVNVSKPGITKGNHYHMTKNEKYLVVSGKCEIKLRQVFSEKVISYVCDDKHLRVVDIPTGYTHSITNIGKKDSVTLMWASELYDPNIPDTIYCPVEQDEENKK
jgi:UDP-2-acetamido-2,6-beta-L-arabino-hexul-4-ose reductase